MNTRIPMLKMEGVSKIFPGVKALDNINITAYKGEVTALMGENGAGKSTLMKILSGVYQKDEGKIFIEGEEAHIKNIKSAEEYGVTIIHQEMSLINNLTIAENIFLGNEKFNKFTKKINKKLLVERSILFLDQIGCNLDPNKLVSSINVGEKQMVEIAKALTKNARIIIMDEPTTALTKIETQNLFKVIENLKKKGIAIIYISHRMEEIFAICDRVEVLRDGKYAGNALIKEIDNNKLIAMMVGRTIEEQFPYKKIEKGKVLLEVSNLTSKVGINNISFTVREGEIVGIAGLMGAGRTELAKTIFGYYKKEKGTIKLKGKRINIKNIQQAINNGICYLSEDRKKEGCILGLSVEDNMILSNLCKYENGFKIINKNKTKKDIDFYIKKLNIKTPNKDQLIKNLSGGNQQKVILAKWLLLSPDILIIDEPTRGIDVGAKKEIYELLNELKESGKAIIMISSDLPEVLGISDRILVMSEGKITGELNREEATQEKIMKLSVGINQ
ncbi:Ribose import ATP-binding protein RbsA [Candidatus Arthromitus sp. SFB-mouse-SU]|uniref:sugar ABC transporter ATP-binding protein n=1 Tax=unclassified Candidatus Neoarthromitus TaxID=2638829 RepID=UPI000229694A|nr:MULTISPECIES: sugar ABC transporter ATP-binding protein [unclassified Candidatus Arthromitus]EIA26064.1 Ribose import ATP-binding protein RbsA [Candidatus Arthromitus sp. SFB-3]EIA26376.1 Ribose import ATP-binding protein RbsA [Candidatus Arthromitus sp. SFB-4]EIA26751.1 Ribose import ATP-binding protein RbsA [Candidatus Arthromitus sp. SFB-5]EIA28597.1 Ribose import ATP-binding protein RbsA [Candidatus Arthromitus sp. SFB-co]EIA30738.1 Ribose import ATP-binding protein RbsA [Candidatus Art